MLKRPTPVHSRIRILIVEGECSTRTELGDLLGHNGFECTLAADPQQARKYLKERAYDLALCDLDLADGSGLRLSRQILDEHPQTAAIIMAGPRRKNRADAALQMDFYGFIVKPPDPNQVLITVANAVRRREIETQHREGATAQEPLGLIHTAESQRQRELQRQLILDAYDLMIGTDAKGILTWVNPRTLKAMGYTEDELIGKHYLRLVREDHRGRAERHYGRQFVKKVPNTYLELPVVTQYGEELWVGVNAQPVMEKGEIQGFQAVARDVTKRQRGEKALNDALEESRKHQAEISALLEGSRAVLEYRELKDAIPSILNSCKRLLGATQGYVTLMVKSASKEDVLFLDSEGVPHHSDRSSPAFIRLLCERAHASCKANYQNRPSVDEWAQLIPDPLTPRENLLFAPLVIKGKAVGLLTLANKSGGFSENDARMAEAFGEFAAVALYNSSTLESLEINEEFFRSVVQTASDAIVSSDSNGNIIFWNQGAEKMFGHSAGEALGKPLTFIMPPRFQEAHQKGLQGLISLGKKNSSGKTIEVVGLRKDGKEFPVELSLATWKTRDGTFFTGISRNTTERKQAEEALHQAKKDAEIANRAKTEFLANMSHEIRTPMNAIIGMADLLQETPLTPEQQQYVRVFNSAGDTLLNLIDDILDLSKLEDGHQLNLEQIEFDPFELVEETCEIMALRAHEKGLELIFQVMPDVPPYLVGDPLRLRQILINLIGNAIKFTEKGDVIVRVARNDPSDAEEGKKAKRSRHTTLLFSVTDTGIGIPPEKIDAIFHIFAQADTSTTRKFGGTGLGLAISKRLVELMGGHLWVKSKMANGSTFYFTANLSVSTRRKKKVIPTTTDALKGLKALILDDNAANLKVLREMFLSAGVEAKSAETGAQALADLKRAKRASHPFDVVMLDSRMPGMGGFEVAEFIKNDPTQAGITIMMLTADHRRNDITRCQELGISACLVKPIKRSGLLGTIEGILRKTGSPDLAPEKLAASPYKDEEALPALRILLVEDSLENCLLVKAFLSKAPYQIDIAENGQVGVEKFMNGKYDLVMMDMQMPIMDGYNATRVIREWEAKRRKRPVPIIALTAYVFEEDAKQSLEAGCTCHLNKPIKKAVLLQTIKDYTQRDKSTIKRRKSTKLSKVAEV
jgi:two-component system sensor histidine kinase/response regulator